MAKDRIISAQARTPEDEAVNFSLRPRTLGDYVGQRELVERLSIAIEAARQRREPMEHVLLHGPPGLGKTTLAHIIAAEMGAAVHITSGPALTKGTNLVGTLTRMQANDVLFIDEIHRLPPAVEEYIYPAMEEFRVDITVDSGLHAKVITVPIKPFTLIGATTRAGLLTGALRSRFGIAHNLRFYDRADLLRILQRSAALLKLTGLSPAALEAIADRSRGTPRVTNRLLRRVRDFAQVRSSAGPGGRIDESIVAAALALEGVDVLGLDELDRAYMKTLLKTYQGGPVGLEAIAATLGEDSGTLEDVVEPFLLQIGFVARTRQGRRLTPQAAEHLGETLADASGLSHTGPEDLLFDAGDDAVGADVEVKPGARVRKPNPAP